MSVGDTGHELVTFIGGVLILGGCGLAGTLAVVNWGLYVGIPLMLFFAFIGQWLGLKFMDVWDGY